MANKLKLGIITDCQAGLSLADKFIERQIEVSVCGFYNKGTEEATEFFKHFTEMSKRKTIELLLDLDALILSLKKPRVVVLVGRNFQRDDIKIFSEKLESGDIIVDCCDVNYKESAMISKQLSRTGIHYLGTGYVFTSDKMMGNPAFMFSGNREVYNFVHPVFSEISSYIEGISCAAYIGPDGAGQFVKMVCTSIYNTFLELIAETIFLLRYTLNIEPDTLKDILVDYSSGEVSSFLLDTTAELIGKKDETTGRFMVDIVLDRIIQSKRDVWIGKYAYDLGCPMPTVTSASNVRLMSGFISERVAASQLIETPAREKLNPSEHKAFIESCRKALYLGMICCVAQSFSLLKKASDAYSWNLNLFKIACTLQGGTFVNSNIMFRVIDAFRTRNVTDNIIVNEYFSKIVKEYCPYVRTLICQIIEKGWPLPALCSIVEYIDCYRCRRLPTPTIQIIKDCIAENGFERIDSAGIFYGDWDSPHDTVTSKQKN